jgi:hypothetical protein
MRSNLGRVLQLRDLNIEENGTDIVLTWREWSAISTVTITSGGTLYSTAPTVTITGAPGVSATATATVALGAVTLVTVVVPGSGYVSPVVAFSGGGGSGAAGTVELYTTDRVTNSRTGNSVSKTATVKAFLHFTLATSMVSQFNVLEAGDAIADFSADVEIDGKEDLRFVIDGEVWEEKSLPDRLARTWDTQFKGQKLYRSVVLRKAT